MRLLLVCCLAALAGACGTSNTAQRAGARRAQPITLRVPVEATSNPLAPQATIQLVARAVCSDQAPCEGFSLDFRNTGGNDFFIHYVPVTADVDAERFEWPDVTLNEQRPAQAVGTFLQLGVDARKFRQIAFARDVTFYLGGTPFEVGYKQREPLRRLLAALEMAP